MSSPVHAGTPAQSEYQLLSNPAAYEFGISDRLRKILDVSGTSVEEAARMFGVTRQAVGAWINGRREPGRTVLMAWAGAFAVPLEWIETGVWPSNLADAWDRLVTQKGPDHAGESVAEAVPCTPWDSNPEPTDSEFWTIVARIEIGA